MIIVTLIYNV